jgi:hypothetical protein
MENPLQQYWEKIKDAILDQWGDEVDEADLEQPLDQEQLCRYFGEKCKLSRQQAEERVKDIMDQIEFRPPGV